MPSLRNIALLVLLFLPLLGRTEDKVLLLELQGAIGPATSNFVLNALENAQRSKARLMILRMDTPGGLDSSMREIIQAILASPVPVATYVAPSGARAASAGTYILYASHIAAMAPATNLGAATPVQIGGMPSPSPSGDEKPDKPSEDKDKGGPEKQADKGAAKAPKSSMENKLINDARAYIRSLAQLRGRNAQWAEQAVSEAASLSAKEALERGVIDVVAVDVVDLLKQINGRMVQVAGGQITLNTTGAEVETIAPDWRNRLLAVITNPQVAYILMLIGIYGLFFELSNPGAVIPGVLGGICLLLALYAFQVLPINYAGLGLILLGLMFMIGEAFLPSFGALGLGGIVAFVIGSLILWDETGPGYEVPLSLILGFAMASGLILISLGTMLLRQRHRPVVSGGEQLLGATGVVQADFEGEGRVWVHGESWLARCDQRLTKGEQVRVVQRDGLVLFVQPLNAGER
jgi:membrane-bound serine protease (ClpP class)